MNYTVLWLPAAEQELARIWLNATDRNAVTGASHRLDQRLRSSPEDEGESRSTNQRVTFDPPLGVLFEVESDDLRVQVIHVWPYSV